MLMMLNPRKKRGRKRKASSRRRRRSSLSSYYSPCSRGGRRRYVKAVRKCKTAKARRAAALAAKRYPKYAKRSEASYMSSGLFGSNPRRRRKHRRNSSFAPGYALNPSGVLKSFSTGFDKSTFEKAGPALGGAIFNAVVGDGMISPLIKGYIPGGFGSNYWVDKALGIVNAGIGAFALSKVAPRYSQWFLVGAVTQVGAKIAYDYLPGGMGMQGLSDYLTTTQAADARALGGMGNMNQGGWIPAYGHGPASDMWAGGMHPGTVSQTEAADGIPTGQTTADMDADAISADGIDTSGLGDYLTTSGAADARPLG